MLRLALNVTRHQLWDLQSKMNDIGLDGVSKIQLQQQSSEKMELHKQIEMLRMETVKLKTANEKMSSRLQENETQIEALERELQELKDGGTPRPDWQRCGSVVDGGESRWKKIMRGKSTFYKNLL